MLLLCSYSVLKGHQWTWQWWSGVRSGCKDSARLSSTAELFSLFLLCPILLQTKAFAIKSEICVI